jgi:hypothetical protein
VGDEELRESNAPPVQIREQLAALPGKTDVIRRFNRNTAWLATGLLSSVSFAALVLALQEWRPKPWQSRAADPAKEERQTSGEALASTNPGTLSKIAGLNVESPTDEIISRQETSVDYGFISPQQIPSRGRKP